MKRLLVTLLALATSTASASPTLNLAARRGRVTVLAEKGLEDLGKDLANSAEAELGAIAADLGDLPQPQAIEVRLVRDAASLAEVAPGVRGAPPWAIGVANPDLGVISVATRRGSISELTPAIIS